MAQSFSYDVIVLGAGASGMAAARAAARLGARVCLVEPLTPGAGSDLLAVRRRALWHAARTYQDILHSRDLGLSCKGLSFEFSEIAAYRDRAAAAFVEHRNKLLPGSGPEIEVKPGFPKFIDDRTVELNGDLLRAQAFILAAGAAESLPEINGLKDARCLSVAQAWNLSRPPKSLAVIGGGRCGCELATFFGSLGTRVEIFESAPSLLHDEDAEVAQLAQGSLAGAGAIIRPNAKIVEVINSRGGVFGLKVQGDNGLQTYAVEQVVVAVGARPNSSGLNLSATKLAVDERGAIKVNDLQETSLRHVFAVGQIAGHPSESTISTLTGSVAGHNAALLALKKRLPRRHSDLRLVPKVIFLNPELASVGLTAASARAKFGRVLVGRAALSSLPRRLADSAPDGLIKLVAHPKTGRLLGCHVFAPVAGEIIQTAALAIQLNAPVEKIAALLPASLTYSEAFLAASGNLTTE